MLSDEQFIEVAKRQRQFWLETAGQLRDPTITQAGPEGSGFTSLDARDVTPMDWYWWWNRQLPGDLRD